jgi:hypothetical protein
MWQIKINTDEYRFAYANVLHDGFHEGKKLAEKLGIGKQGLEENQREIMKNPVSLEMNLNDELVKNIDIKVEDFIRRMEAIDFNSKSIFDNFSQQLIQKADDMISYVVQKNEEDLKFKVDMNWKRGDLHQKLISTNELIQ